MDFGAYFKESKITLSVFLARLLTVVFVLLTVVGVVYNSMNQEFCGATKADRNWTDQNGNAYDVTSFQDQGDGDAIYYQMPEISYDQVLFFRARNMFVDV